MSNREGKYKRAGKAYLRESEALESFEVRQNVRETWNSFLKVLFFANKEQKGTILLWIYGRIANIIIK